VDSPLAGIPIERRRLLAATLGLFAVLFVAVGVVASTGATPGVVRVFSAVALVVAMVLGAIAWGVTHSVTIDVREQRLDRAIERAMAERAPTGGHPLSCGCGHDHDADELHVTDADAGRCPVSGTDCAHSCDSCVLASMRPSPVRSRAERLSQ
jgi:hypothetical protein